MTRPLHEFAPLFEKDEYSERDQWHLSPFFTNLDRSVYASFIPSPELIGALCSRTSRAPDDLRYIYLNEFVYPFTNPIRDPKDTDAAWEERVEYGVTLKAFIEFLHAHSLEEIFSHPRAREFYLRNLVQYGDDSIAQMAGSHLVFWGISQVAIKHLEDQRIGLAPIEKSTRYVNYSRKVHGQYLYYIDPTLSDLGLREKYCAAMDGLFETYTALIPRMIEWLTKQFPEEKKSVIEKKAFDTLRGLLPCATLSQVAFFGNGQAFEHMINRSRRHSLGEICWAADQVQQELYRTIPSFLRRIMDVEKQELITEYQTYLVGKKSRIAPFIAQYFREENLLDHKSAVKPGVKLVQYDSDTEVHVIAGMLYPGQGNHYSWEENVEKVRALGTLERRKILESYLSGRTDRWQKVGRAFEYSYHRFEIIMDIGAYRDIQRHRMLTQDRQYFSCHHDYDVPPEVTEAGLETEFRSAIWRAEDVFNALEHLNPELAQYPVTLAHRVRFMQWENWRQETWQDELRSIPEGHPAYRHIVQEKFRLLAEKFPLLTEHMRVNMDEYDFARRGQEERIQKKLKKLL